MSPNEFSPATRATLRRRSILLASVFGLAVAGFAATQTVIPQTPALAQIRTERSPGQYSFADVVDKVRPAVVSVRVKVDTPQVGLLDNSEGSGRENLPPQIEQFMRRFFGDQPGMGQGPRNRRVTGQGSGFFVSGDGFIVTNNHVVERATEVEITTDNGMTYTAKVVGTDSRTDVALLKVDGRGYDFPWVKFSTTAPRVGDWVLAVGNPFGLGGTVTSGIVSARGRDIGAGTYDDFLQIDAAVNRGNSGGPTFNLAGEVIGVNTAIVSPSGGNIGIAFAIPAETVERVVASLKETGSVTRGYLGVQIQPVTPEIAESLSLKEAQGALVADVQGDTPAAKAGIKAGDVVISVDGQAIKDARELSRRIAGFQPGATVKLNVLRDGKERTFEVVLSKLPEQRAAEKPNAPKREQGAEVPRLGLSLAPADSVAGAGREGVVVTEVDPKGPAAERGLKSGDVILEVAGRAVANPAEVRDALSQARKDGKGVVLLRVKTENGTRFVTVPVGRG
ncbi:MAG TPA: Do family serine endopeptidase [Xanthobacteraceae bacterium]|nr:Do family serine endopeptidase [Xanthobacteraceae bacterium]